MSDLITRFNEALGEYLPSVARRLTDGGDADVSQAIAGGFRALERGSLSWAQLNQILHRLSEGGMSEGFFRYYFLEVPEQHPYPVELVLGPESFRPPEGADEVLSVKQLQWGFRRFIYDAMLYWGNFRQAYRELRQRTQDEIAQLFASKRADEGRMIRRGKVSEPTLISKDHRYLISEMACKTYETSRSVEETDHVQLALRAFRELRSAGEEVTPAGLKEKTKAIAKGAEQGDLFDLMYEDAQTVLQSEAEVVSLYSGQWEAFQRTRSAALENTRIYLSICSDLDVYVATSMRIRDDFRDMADTCERIFRSDALTARG